MTIAFSGISMAEFASGERNGQQLVDAKNNTAISLSTQIANPVVYKLVRVDGNGRLVPATEDELMEVENMSEEEKVEAPSTADTGKVEGNVLTKESPSVEAQAEESEGKLQGENAKIDMEKLNARLEYIGVMLQKVKQEEKLRLSSPSPDHSSSYMIVDGQGFDQNLSAVGEKQLTGHSLQKPSLSSPRLNNSCKNHLGIRETCLDHTGDLAVGGSSTSASCSSSMPDFSSIKGEICLDNLTIRQLQETFRATFGRETTVKDKLWLKRRIAMGLTNSCDVSTTSFIIKDNVLVRNTVKEVHCGTGSDKNVIQINEMVLDRCKDSPSNPSIQIGDGQIGFCKRLRKRQTEYECKTDDACNEQSVAKRVRKPTKRYIEELSDADHRESGGRSGSSIKTSGHGQSPPKSCVVPVCDVSLDEPSLVTRQDSLGGSGVQIPYVCRARRGRPRENFISIMHYHPSGMGMESRLLQNAVDVHISQLDSEIGDRKDIGVPERIQLQVAKTDREKENVVKCLDEEKQVVQFENLDSLGDSSECNMTFSISKDGVRRKHHRAWTLSEVIKLVEGVSKYGAGRWSEIKKVSFASHTYRTSVDLKDKWRNLLRASFSQGLNDNGMGNSRKHGSIPIPAPILLRVRQLAEKHSQAVPDLSSVKFAAFGGRNVHETRTGFL